MNLQNKLQKVEKMIASIQKEMMSNSSAGQMKNQKTLLNMYMKKKEELEKQMKQ